ncbi:RNA-binding protein 28-like [Mizuhopecten yessoensis]|uniref:RNA-binding protein 28 n=1 Tax=Mizuhopecten yessoensis TaxID=6573 RepID=A0A210QDV4_MIZYE|nr:RNA-binding protein 28-like [Mizuhopecten yessoensis]OWF46848.1 RNA-binding protein 28 [Mizuhopecten yessoensis]
MADEATHVRKSKTLFLRNLPYSTTNEKLEEIFGDIGPLKTCFVVKPKGAEKCRGFGYVAYSMLEDAEKAKDSVKSLDGRKIMITFAERKKENRMRMGTDRKVPPVKKEVKEEAEEEKSSDDEESDREEKDKEGKPSEVDKQQMKYLWSKTLLVSGWKDGTSLEDVQKYITKNNVKNIGKLEFPMRNCEQATAMMRFKSIRDTNAGQRKLESKPGKGNMLTVRCQKDSFNVVSQRALKQCRLIVRNLSFKCTEDKLHEYFAKFGEVTEVKIPLKPDGKMLGFGFVQFEQIEDADRAVKGMNMKPILGRPVAVDWTLPKDKFVASQTSKGEAEPRTQVSKSQTASRTLDRKPQIKKESVINDDDEQDTLSDEGSFSTENEGSDNMEEEEDSEDKEEEDESESESDDEGFADEDDKDEDDSSDEEEMDDDSIQENRKKKNKKKGGIQRKNDVEEGRTLFIRNVTFETVEETLVEELEEFGPINYCRLVMDPHTEHSRGMAFVQFKTVEAAKKCMEKANDESRDGGITVEGRKLFIALAVSRDKAKEFKQAEKKKEEDKRNLHLAREGMIRPGTQAAEGLSKEDLQKRIKVENMKREKLKSPSIFISTTRLCVRNLPLQYTDKELKTLFLQVAGDKKAVINESRIMVDLDRVNGQGKAKSRGYGFVNFTDHKHALQALREANNNPNLFEEKRRLIVEFSLENKTALQAKEKKLERHKARQAQLEQKRETAATNTDVKEEKPKGRPKKDKTSTSKDKLTDKFIGKIEHEEGSEDKKLPKGLPSHWGAKVRHKPRQSKIELEKKQKKKAKKLRQKQQRGEAVISQPISNKRQHAEPSAQAPPLKKKKHSSKEKRDDFDKLVNRYKQKFTAGNTSKWFES